MKRQTTLAERLKWIITEKELKQNEFAKTLGVSANYIYLLTSGRKMNISETLAKLIEKTYGYPAQWVLAGDTVSELDSKRELQAGMLEKLQAMNRSELLTVAEFIHTLSDKE